MRAIVAVVFLAACSSPGEPTCGPGTTLEGTTCVPDLVSCGEGTEEVGGECVPTVVPGAVRVLVPSIVVGDGNAVEVRVLATDDDGAPTTADIVLNTDRPGIGTFASPQLSISPSTSATTFTPCSATTPGCAGPAQITVALASAPSQIIARAPFELVSEEAVGSIEMCPVPNTFHGRGSSYLHDGGVTIIDGTWVALGGARRVEVTMGSGGATVGMWSVELSTVALQQDLAPGVYTGARQPGVQLAGRPGMRVRGPDPQPDCEPEGEFQIHDVEHDGTQLVRLVASFRQRCLQTTAPAFEGCIHYEKEQP